jgi:hypothetical protein
MFDNRTVAFPTDFPSAARLEEAGVEAVVLVQEGDHAPRSDLAQTLAVWQRAGVVMNVVRADAPVAARPIHVEGPGLFERMRLMWARFSAQGNARDGFGRYLPGPSQGG